MKHRSGAALAAVLVLTPLPSPAQASAKAAKGPAGAGRSLDPARAMATAPAEYRARLTTTKGEIVIHVRRAWAPLAADRFYNLVRNGFYDGCSFHRVLPGFVVQFGLHPNPAVQARWEKATLKDETVKQSNRLGYVAFAASGAHSRNTQVFISLKDNAPLDVQGFVPFGDVVQGIGISALLYNGYRDRPDQQRILRAGDAYLKKNFPNLDGIKKAVIE